MKPIKSSFPIFDKYPELVYLDNAATTQRPQVVIDRVTDFFSKENANIHRGVYDLSNHATENFEVVRQKIADWLNAPSSDCIAFTAGTTASINTVAQSYLTNKLKPGQNIVTTILEHHGNFIPWQQLAKTKGAELRVTPILHNGELDLSALIDLIDEHTAIVAVNHISNTLGTVNDIQAIIEAAHQKNIPVLIDAAQSAAIAPPDWQTLQYDFLAFSGHKVFGPFGVGVLFAAPKHHKEIKPFLFGGGIIRDVQVTDTLFNNYPHNLDAGTPNVDGVIGLGAAMDFLKSLDIKKAVDHLSDLTDYAAIQLQQIDGLTLIGQPTKRAGIFSFQLAGIHPHEVASFLNKDQIAVRAGMHCTQPLLDHLGKGATVRASFAIYNERADADRLTASIKELISFWS